jgi:hypothetical protein
MEYYSSLDSHHPIPKEPLLGDFHAHYSYVDLGRAKFELIAEGIFSLARVGLLIFCRSVDKTMIQSHLELLNLNKNLLEKLLQPKLIKSFPQASFLNHKSLKLFL